ncbi:16S rRNA (guanine(966)-N(2))-methyltransferase RsmD [Neisseriaceae bacterium PsAf]|nr:16S rRNA (guanine(966)-N(2))-methyltransferase RsmD [Neisseriaceae bacterium PsAf]MCV2503499.1 16S rRNA (guanine(966)-N(2))-methyltransferase RsmD [Neisseriaceae bacterium]
MHKKSKHHNQVRIIAGSHRSRWVKFPDIEGLRPTSDMVREKVFNWLGQYLPNQKVLDLFSGSGGFAFESASRGANYVVAVESNSEIYQAIQNNRKALELFDVHPIQQNALSYLQSIEEKFDVIFLDPPYVWDKWDQLLHLLPNYLKNQGYAYVESGHSIDFPQTLEIVKQGKSGKSYYYLISLSLV